VLAAAYFCASRLAPAEFPCSLFSQQLKSLILMFVLTSLLRSQLNHKALAKEAFTYLLAREILTSRCASATQPLEVSSLRLSQFH
jgi:hypothetical protein